MPAAAQNENEALQWTGERLVTTLQNETKFEHLHRYALAQSFSKAKAVLDIASGEGYGSNLLAAVAASVTGVDIDPDATAAASRKYVRPNLRYLQVLRRANSLRLRFLRSRRLL